MGRGLVDDAKDWFKYFKCSEIALTCLPGPVINAERGAGLRKIFRYKLTHYPVQTLRLLRRCMRQMPLRDVVYLIIKTVPRPEAGGDQERDAFARVGTSRAQRCGGELDDAPG